MHFIYECVSVTLPSRDGMCIIYPAARELVRAHAGMCVFVRLGGCPSGWMWVWVNVLTPGQTKQLSLSIKLPFMLEKMSLIISESPANDH